MNHRKRLLPALLDTNGNGLSDLWEMQFNGGELFPPDFDPQADPDGDGWTNAQEAVAGTNPFDSTSPGGFLRPQIAYIPAVWSVPVENEPPELITPEAVTITWPTVPGKLYTLFCSPDLTAESWIAVDDPLIGNGTDMGHGITLTQPNGSRPDAMFWRVKVEDIDSDADGLTDAEEYRLGTDPNNAQTLPGIPDLWLAAHFTDILLAAGPAAIDPNADLDGDGLTNAQEAFLGTDPNVPDNPGILQDAIANGDFSQPVIGSTPSNTSDSTWDYWGEGAVPGWTAVVGHNIEFQNITSTPAGNQYCELKAHPEGHYGIKQRVGTRAGATYLLVLDCRDRADVAPVCSTFDVRVDGQTVRRIDFTAPGTPTPPGAWTNVVIPFTAANCITEISLVPVNTLEDTTGCLVDNVKVVQVTITVTFGSGPEPLGDNTSRCLLEEYLETIKVASLGDTWFVKYTDAQGVETLHGVEVATAKEKLIAALKRPGQVVVFDGHSNFGLGPNFSAKVTHKTIADFTHFGVGKTSIPKSFRGDGTESDIIQFTKGDGTTLPENPQDLAAIERVYAEGWAYLTLDPGQIVQSPQNYLVQPLGIEASFITPAIQAVTISSRSNMVILSILRTRAGLNAPPRSLFKA